MIRVLLADDHSIIRAGLRRLLEDAGDMEVEEAADGCQALKLAKDSPPDVAVKDISMPGLDGLEAIQRLREILPELPILVLTMHKEEQYVVRCLTAGARGYLTKRGAPEQLVNAICRVLAGVRFLSDEVAEAFAVRVARGKDEMSPLKNLSNRELQVFRALALGKTNCGIADDYSLSVKTVDTYRFRLLKKLGLCNNAELSHFVIKHGLIQP